MPEQGPEFNQDSPEITLLASNFYEMVIESQKRWKSLKQNPLKEFSQAADIPETISKNLLRLVIDNLPPYIPEELKVKIRETHPNPIIAVGVLPDKRFFPDNPAVESDFLTPDNIEGEEDRQAYARGMTLLDEIATDTLAQDVIHHLGRKHQWFRPVAAMLENRNPARSIYKTELKRIEQIFGGKEKFESFRQSLILAMLNGQNGPVEGQLKELGYETLDKFAIEMGRNAKYSEAMMDFLNKITTPRVANLFIGGIVTADFPGVINIPLAHVLPASVNMLGASYNIEQLLTKMDNPALAGVNLLALTFNSYWALRPGLIIPLALIHETCHYLSQDTTRSGLQVIEYIRSTPSLS